QGLPLRGPSRGKVPQSASFHPNLSVFGSGPSKNINGVNLRLGSFAIPIRLFCEKRRPLQAASSRQEGWKDQYCEAMMPPMMPEAIEISRKSLSTLTHCWP